jgi:hypothetical protein
MAIVCGDIHGNVEKAKTFLAYKPDDLHIALGDYVDSFYEPPSRQFRALRLLLRSSAVLLWGNHDLHYLKTPPWFCTGRQEHNQNILDSYINIYTRHKKRFLAAYAVDGWLCTHAGVNTMLQQRFDDVSAIADSLNAAFAGWMKKPVCYHFPSGRIATEPDSIFNIGFGRGGGSGMGGIFWFDYKREPGLAQIKQLFGHTETKEGPIIGKTFVALDTTNNKSACWVYDTSIGEVVRLDLPRHIPAIADLPEDEQGPFSEYLIGKTVPKIGGYNEGDYMRWKESYIWR